MNECLFYGPYNVKNSIPTGIILPGVNDDGQLWKALKALIPIHVCLSLLHYHNVVALSL